MEYGHLTDVGEGCRCWLQPPSRPCSSMSEPESNGGQWVGSEHVAWSQWRACVEALGHVMLLLLFTCAMLALPYCALCRACWGN